MELQDAHADHDTEEEQSPTRPRQLPDDLPKSLDDRRTIPHYGRETEMYDAWQGVSNISPLEPSVRLLMRQSSSRAISVLDRPSRCSTSQLQFVFRRDIIRRRSDHVPTRRQ